MKYNCTGAEIKLNEAQKKLYQELYDEGKGVIVLTKDANRQIEMVHNLLIRPTSLHSVAEMIATAIIGFSEEMGVTIDDFYDDIGRQTVALLLKNYIE